MDIVRIGLKEWEILSPDKGSALEGLKLSSDKSVSDLVDFLSENRKLKILQLQKGLLIEAYSHVGTLRLGNIKITINPKITGQPLMNLLRYAYGIRNLKLYTPLKVGVENQTFQDLLIYQLYLEAKEIISRGIKREYLPWKQDLNTIKGKIDFGQLLHQGGINKQTIPCIYHPRLEDCIFNRVMKSGLKFSSALTEDPELRISIRQTISLLDDYVSDEKLSRDLTAQAKNLITRLTAAYGSIFNIIELLMESSGISLEKEQRIRLPGFLFDMNRFFQALISRFLKETLRDYTINDEYRIKGMMSYRPSHNPLNRKSPTPRPDYAVIKNGKLISLLDAKYRDLWENNLPRDMLYQLGIYALSQKDNRTSTILYPAADPLAKEARVEINDPVYGGRLAQVVLRPVNLVRLNEIISEPMTRQKERDRKKMAFYMTFGSE